MILKKLRSRRGLTLAEALAALAVFAILSVALVQGTTAAWKVYQKAVVASEARTLQSTLSQALSNELRYARNIHIENGTVFFNSETYGANSSVHNSENGRIQIGPEESPYDLLPEKAYTGGLEAVAALDYSTGIFTVELTISHDLIPNGITSELRVQALNAVIPSSP